MEYTTNQHRHALLGLLSRKYTEQDAWDFLQLIGPEIGAFGNHFRKQDNVISLGPDIFGGWQLTFGAPDLPTFTQCFLWE